MIGAAIKTFIGGNVLYLGLGAAFVTLVIGWDSSRKAKWVESGKGQVRVEIQKANDATVQTSTRIRAKSNSGSVRGERDPYTAD